MIRNFLLGLSLFLFSGCSGSDILKDLIGFEDTKATLNTANMNAQFSINFDVNEVIFNPSNPLPTDIIRASYFIEDKDGNQLFEYKAVLETTINTICNQNLVESDGITYNCNTTYSNSQAYPGYDRNKTIKLLNDEVYTVRMEEVRSLSGSKYKTIGTVQIKD